MVKVKIDAFKIRKLFRSSVPKLRMYLDIELFRPEHGDIGVLDFRLACTIYEHFNPETIKTQLEKKHFWNIEDLALYILSKTQKKTSLNIYTHNAEFDVWASGILPILAKFSWVLKFFYAQGSTFLLVCKKEGASIWFISSTNYYPFKLKTIGDLLHFPKLDTDVFTEDEEDLLTYCERDTEIVRKAMNEWFNFIKKGGYGGYALTIPSQAFKAFRCRFYEYTIYPHKNEGMKTLERRSYFGGRTENFYQGEFSSGPFSKLDVNSMYPNVMKNNSFPTKLFDIFGEISIEHLKKILEIYLVIAEVVINTDERVYPVRFNNKVLFPVGEFKAVLCSEGLSYAISKGHLVKIIKGGMYEGRFIFRSYVDHFYPLKIQAKKSGDTLHLVQVKLMLTSLYGKFGEHHNLYEKREEFTGPDCYRRIVTATGEGIIGIETKLLNLVQSPTGEEDTGHTFYAICAHVTEYARFFLWRLFQRIGLKRIYYCDTDSLIIRKKYLYLIKDLLDDWRLGSLQNEGESDSIILKAPKWYKFGDTWTRKGLPASAIEIGINTWKYNTFEKSATMIKKGLSSGIIRKEVTKTFSFEITKGKVNEFGQIAPFRLPYDVRLLHSSTLNLQALFCPPGLNYSNLFVWLSFLLKLLSGYSLV